MQSHHTLDGVGGTFSSVLTIILCYIHVYLQWGERDAEDVSPFSVCAFDAFAHGLMHDVSRLQNMVSVRVCSVQR